MARILVLDDSPVVLGILAGQLEEEHEVVCCGDWTEANQRLHQRDIDLLIVDQELGQFHGTYFVRAVRDFFGPALPIVVLSATPVATAALSAGADGFVAKKDAGVLPAIIERLLTCPRRDPCAVVVEDGATSCAHCPVARSLHPGDGGDQQRPLASA